MYESDLSTYIESIVTSDKFLSSVRRASITLSDRGSISDTVIIDTAIQDSFPRVILRIATTKTKEGNPVFNGLGMGSDYAEQEREVFKVITQEPFSSGLIRVVSSLTAAKLIRSLPLNTDLRFLDSSKFIEEQAIADLDSLIGILIDTPNLVESLIKETQSSNFFFSQEIDLRTIPPYVFDQVLDQIARLDNVKLQEVIVIPDNTIAEVQISISNVDSIKELRLPLKNGEVVSDVVAKIANLINEALISIQANLIASVTINPPIPTSLKYSKRELYGDNLNGHKELTFTIYPSIHRIQIVAKSPTINTDKQLISINCLTRTLEGEVIGGITGLVYGTTSIYKNLTIKGPHSLIIDTNRLPLSESNLLTKVDIGEIDSFHFRLKDGYSQTKAGKLLIRISNLPSSSQPTQWYIDTPTTQPHIINSLIHDSFYQRRISTQVITSMGTVNSLQVIAFVLCPKEVKIVVDILDIPEGLEIATGSLTQVMTNYSEYPRSVTIKSQLDYVNYARITNEKDEPVGIGGTVAPRYSSTYNYLRKKLNKLERCKREEGLC